jgi:MFS transporter, putative metabolite:H+ symporter
VALISLGGFFEFYDLFFAGYIAPGLVRPAWSGPPESRASSPRYFPGCSLAPAVVSFVAGRFGRRTIFTYSLLWYTVHADFFPGSAWAWNW